MDWSLKKEEYVVSHSDWKQIPHFHYLGKNNQVCGGAVTLIGHRLRPMDVLRHVTDAGKKEIMEIWSLNEEQIQECMDWLEEAAANEQKPKAKLQIDFGSLELLAFVLTSIVLFSNGHVIGGGVCLGIVFFGLSIQNKEPKNGKN